MQPDVAELVDRWTMPAYFDDNGRPRCSKCFHDLTTHGSSGRCPSCGTWYMADRSRVAPGRVRMLQLMADAPTMVASLPPVVLRILAQILVVLMNLLVIGGIGVLAYRALVGRFM